MRSLSYFLMTFLIFAILYNCAGSKKSTQYGMPFQNDELQNQVEELQEKIEKNPNNLEYRRQLATLFHENGRANDALRVLEDGFAIDPNDAESKYLYAEIAMSTGARKKAFQAYKDVLQSLDGEDYLDRIAPKFTDAFKVTKVVGSAADEAFGQFSQSGERIVFQTNRNGNWDIYEYVFSTDTTNQLTFSESHEENPVLSPDGSKLVYTSTQEDHRDVDYDQKLRDIFLYDLENGRERNLTTNGSNDWRPRFSEDGKYIAFVSERSDLREVPFYQRLGDIYLMEADGRFQMQLTKNEVNDGGPSIAPGSTEEKGTIYFDSNENGKYEIYKIDIRGEDRRRITFNPDYNDVAPDVSPSGDKIVFFSDRDGNYEIYMMNNDGSAPQRLTANPADDLNPVFSPDGTKVLFHSNRNGNYDIFLLDLTQQNASPALYEVVSKIDAALAAM